MFNISDANTMAQYLSLNRLVNTLQGKLFVFSCFFLLVLAGHSQNNCYSTNSPSFSFTSGSGQTVSKTMNLQGNCSGTISYYGGNPPSWVSVSIGTFSNGSLPITITTTSSNTSSSERTGGFALRFGNDTPFGSVSISQAGTAPPPPPPPPCTVNLDNQSSQYADTGETRDYVIEYPNCTPPINPNYTFQRVSGPAFANVSQISYNTIRITAPTNPQFGSSRTAVYQITDANGQIPGFSIQVSQECRTSIWYPDSDGDGFRDQGSQGVALCGHQEPEYTLNTAEDGCIDVPYNSNNGCPPPCSVDLDPNNVHFTDSGGSATIGMSNFSDGCTTPRTITYGNVPAWLSVSGTNAINIVAQPNTETDTRGEQINVIVNGEVVNSFVISQDGKPAPPPPPPPTCDVSLMINNAEVPTGAFELDPYGQTFTINVNFSDPSCEENLRLIDVTTGGTLENWLQAGPYNFGAQTFTVSSTLNNLYNSRNAYIGVVSDADPNILYGVIFVNQPSCQVNWYPDTDGDTLGDVYAAGVVGCSAPNYNDGINWVSNNDDLCPEVFGTVANQGCPPDQIPENYNTITSRGYDIDGTLKGAGKGYFDELGKPFQNQAWNLRTNDIWVSETRYDQWSRPALQTLSAPVRSGNTFVFSPNFIRKSNGSDPYGIADYTGANIERPATVGKTANTLGWYYSEQNNREAYQDITDYPFSSVVYSSLNPDTPLRVLGGNVVDSNKNGSIDPNDTWAQGYTFRMKAGQELSQSVAFGETTYNTVETLKTVSRDVHGVENVVFTDSDGKVLASARSGGTTNRTMTVAITEQGFIDVHIPTGASGITITNTAGVAGTTIYDLLTDSAIGTNAASLPPGFYRVAINDFNPDTYNLSQPVTVGYQENYYDYTLNEYDQADRLTDSHQPLGSTIASKPTTSYTFDSLGRLVGTESPDEGVSEFIYREDGQIRFSQNSEQAKVSEVSYTNYDSLGRPEESGVWIGANFGSLDENSVVGSNTKEVLRTVYDVIDPGSFAPEMPSAYRNPSFLAGNVAYTESEYASTWYSYDIYGRVRWMVQDLVDIGHKTIDYEYHPVTGLVSKVVYQNGVNGEEFTHEYDYDNADQLAEVRTVLYGGATETHAQYEYYENGAMKRTILAGGVQAVDYVYNLAGQLKAINNPAQGPTHNPSDPIDLFGMQIDYHSNDYNRSVSSIQPATLGQDLFNGTIKSIRWNSGTSAPAPGSEEIYAYSYDRNNWLTAADYRADGLGTGQISDPLVLVDEIVNDQEQREYTNPVSITVRPNSHFRFGSEVYLSIEGGGALGGEYDVSNITYDANGNIQSLRRNKNNADAGTAMDDLSYTYKTDPQDGPNQLLQVADAAGDVPGADDIGSQGANNYIYNDIGQLTDNFSEGISYEYNPAGLVTAVLKDGLARVRFYYNDRNHRVKKEQYQSDGTTLLMTTYYVRDVSGSVLAIYTKELSGTPELREHPIHGVGRIGVYNRSGNTGSTLYELTDHLGNVRAVFSKNGTATFNENFSDYYPFGMPMPGRNIVGDYRYAFQGQEKDQETGKEAFELRLWDSRIGRWLKPDPYRQYHSPYLGMGNIPSSAFDSDGGYVYIMGKNGRLLRLYNKVYNSEIGASAIDYFINNPDSHVIISETSVSGAGGFTLPLGPRVGSGTLTESYINSILNSYTAKDKIKFSGLKNFVGAEYQNGTNYLIAIDYDGNPKVHSQFNLEAAFHELYAHAYANEIGIKDTENNPDLEHEAFGGSKTGVYSQVPKTPRLGPPFLSYPITEFYNSQLMKTEMGETFVGPGAQIFDFNILNFLNDSGRIFRREGPSCNCDN